MSRNMGISLACGEYIQLVDNDDFLIKTALEELYTLSKDADADVVYTASRYSYMEGQTRLSKSESFTDTPTLEVDASESLVQKFLSQRVYYFWAPWTKFVRRKLLIENEIIFPATPSHEDLTWTIELLCCAKRFLQIPNAVYCCRENTESLTRSRRPPLEHLNFWTSVISIVIKAVDDLWSKYDVLKKNPEWLHKAQNYLFNDCFMSGSFVARAQLSPEAVYEALRPTFSIDNKNLSGSYIPFLYSRLDFMHKQLIINQQQFNQFAAQAQARIAELEAQLKIK